ncbi:hypothetical protein NEPAR04_1280 [Nematocida parisii]|nr:hypothetical protein NEPAR08_1273 [Nematocida parisii]KAI5128600.1 hypothetical protein NEPAR03_1407 [Nematocida parisii]KAI5141897.1 hypothetical protein NEPAR04_1280 [Nematocida parisii]
MQRKESSSIKNLIIHSALLELYYKQKKPQDLSGILKKIHVLNRFTLIEVICAKIYSNMVIAHLPQYTSIEVFFTSCIIFKKYWSDFSLKNIEEIDTEIIDIKKMNRVEMAILRQINYAIHITTEQIQKEIEAEQSVDINYQEAMSSMSFYAIKSGE